ncbi:cytochrome c3 family protein [Haliangium sp.]|uniref:cytochrome c3 family protein n=1 Tax=Haliangium sp. TaxID=2663208 RepID=UPI003D1403D7
MARFTFPEWTETFKKWLGLLLAGTPVYLVALVAYGVEPEAIRIGYQPEQPVPYSHALHVGQLGLDCRYCHNTVERSGHAAIPPVATCMNCHQGIHPDSQRLEPVRAAYTDGVPLAWVRVNDLPDYVYFNHSAHVTRGIGCESCHGRVDLMEKVYQAEALNMEWCLNCHRNPEQHLRPPAEVTVMGYQPQGGNQLQAGQALAKQNKINPPTDCSTCHR